MREGGWGELTGVLVCGKTLGLVGFGAIARGTANRSRGFDMKVLAYDPYVSKEARLEFPATEFVTLDRLLEESDFVSLHAAATPETKGMFNSARFAQMKRSAYFINTSRGSLVDEAALMEALSSGSIAGAAIDVYSKEPPPKGEDHSKVDQDLHALLNEERADCFGCDRTGALRDP